MKRVWKLRFFLAIMRISTYLRRMPEHIGKTELLPDRPLRLPASSIRPGVCLPKRRFKLMIQRHLSRAPECGEGFCLLVPMIGLAILLTFMATLPFLLAEEYDERNDGGQRLTRTHLMNASTVVGGTALACIPVLFLGPYFKRKRIKALYGLERNTHTGCEGQTDGWLLAWMQVTSKG